MKNLEIFAAVALALALIGFVAGTRDAAYETNAPAPTRAIPSAGAAPAASYTDLRDTARGPNAQWTATLSPLSKETKSRGWDSYVGAREDERERRASRRAYDGAPPVVPHPIDQRDAPSCLACHADGVALPDGRVAAPMSHDAYTSCVQCHAASRAPSPLTNTPGVANHFEGAHAAGPGSRAWPGAPPTIPHDTLMRSRCTSCHGAHSAQGLASSHPERQACVQCHAESRPR